MTALIRQRGTGQNRSGFRQAITLDDHATGSFLPLTRKRRRQRHGTGDRVTNGGKVCLCSRGESQDPLKHGRNTDKEGDRVPFMRVKSHLRIEFREEDLGGRLAHGRAQEERQPEGMEVGEKRKEGFRAFVQLPHPEHALVDVDSDVAVGKGSRLGDAVWSGSMQDDRAIVG